MVRYTRKRKNQGLFTGIPDFYLKTMKNCFAQAAVFFAGQVGFIRVKFPGISFSDKNPGLQRGLLKYLRKKNRKCLENTILSGIFIYYI